MSSSVRLSAFAALLAAAFAASLALGAAVGPDRTAAADRHDDMGGGHDAMAADPVRGLAASDHGLTLALGRTAAAPGSPFALRFRITDADGATVRDFDVEHTKRMHLIVVRRDLTGFQHLHPEQQPDGSWSVPVALAAAGTYRVLADFSVGGEAQTLGADLQVDGPVRSRALPQPVDTVDVDGLRVARDADLGFTVTRDGAPVPLEDYLGAKGHLVALREGDLAFLHVHPDADRLRFEADFPSAGRYRLFLQFKTGGQVHTAAFTEEVSR